MSSTVQLNLVNWMTSRLGKFKYSMDMDKRWPVGPYADCSSLVRAAYKEVAGIEIGTYTGDQQRYGTQVFGAECPTVEAAVALLQLGDLVFYDWDGVDVAKHDHVDMYIGDGRVCGHGGPGDGPVIMTLRSQWDSAHTITARRYVTSSTATQPPTTGGNTVTQEQAARIIALLEQISSQTLTVADAVTAGREGVKFDGDLYAQAALAASRLAGVTHITSEAQPIDPAKLAAVTDAVSAMQASVTTMSEALAGLAGK